MRRRGLRWGRLLSPMDVMFLYLDNELEGDFSFLELVEVFGEEGTARFMKAFSGKTLRVPSRSMFKRAYHAAFAYVEVEKHRQVRGFEAAVVRAAAKLGEPPDRIKRWHGEISKVADEMEGCLAEMRETSVRDDEAGQGLSPML